MLFQNAVSEKRNRQWFWENNLPEERERESGKEYASGENRFSVVSRGGNPVFPRGRIPGFGVPFSLRSIFFQ